MQLLRKLYDGNWANTAKYWGAFTAMWRQSILTTTWYITFLPINNNLTSENIWTAREYDVMCSLFIMNALYSFMWSVYTFTVSLHCDRRLCWILLDFIVINSNRLITRRTLLVTVWRGLCQASRCWRVTWKVNSWLNECKCYKNTTPSTSHSTKLEQ